VARTLSDLRSLVKDNIHNDSSVSDSRIDSWINLAQDDAEQKVLRRYLGALSNIITEDGVNSYVIMEQDFRSFRQFWQTDSPAKLSYVPYDEFVRYKPDPLQKGKPIRWSFLRFTSGFPTILFDPIPDDAYTIEYEYLANLPDLINDSDVSLISQLGWDKILEAGASKRYYRKRSTADYQVWKDIHEENLDEFRRQLTQTQGASRMYASFMASQVESNFYGIPIEPIVA
jgi:hypothetical protein